MSQTKLSSRYQGQFAALQETAAAALEQIFMQSGTVTATIRREGDVSDMLAGEHTPAVALSFLNGVGDQHLVLVSADLALQLYAWMLGEAEPAADLSEDHLEGLQEALRQVAGQLQMAGDGNPAAFDVDQLDAQVIGDAAELAGAVGNAPGVSVEVTVAVPGGETAFKHYWWSAQPDGKDSSVEDNDAGGAVGAAIDVQPAQFGAMTGNGNGANGGHNVDMLLDVELVLTVELGRKTMLISDILKLGKGSIVELEKSAGEPLHVLVNGRKFAEGEVVVVDDHFAIRLTHLVSPRDRINSLR